MSIYVFIFRYISLLTLNINKAYLISKNIYRNINVVNFIEYDRIKFMIVDVDS